MLLPIFIIIPFMGGILCWLFDRYGIKISHYIALVLMSIVLMLSISLLFYDLTLVSTNTNKSYWNFEYEVSWIKRFGIMFHLAADGFSILMLILTSILGIISILCSWDTVEDRIGLFYLNLLWILSFSIGIFLSIDLFLFFLFWEMIIFPVYFSIIFWGHRINDARTCLKRYAAANKFFMYSQCSGLILLFSILYLVYSYYASNHILSFNYDLLRSIKLNDFSESCIMLGFFLAFAIKVPIFPFHGWFAEFHTYSPISGALDISSILLKTSVYALLRFNIVLFPNSSSRFAYVFMLLGVITIFYASFVAFSQTDIKRLIAYTSISHTGFILIAIYSANQIAYQGIIIQTIAYAFSTAALYSLVGQLFQYTHTRNMKQMGGLWSNICWIPGFSMFFAAANLGMPGTGNFVGEFMILLGTFNNNVLLSSIVSFSLIISALCSLIMIQRTYFGYSFQYTCKHFIRRISRREMFISISLLVMLILIGLYPNIILNMSESPINNIRTVFSNFILTTRS
ncbi:NuoM family protein [Buchnera aphidicola]|uniref:NADH-quinone oxidoreductase subunit M n=1 Tax=Buchnera aphidicola subsp. Melaphis rhois TaxID=118103 RepID=A0A4D6Y0M3_BUCMH|nr:NADH-quinone oxidoreductase subunit M [Buchnera aphidicola]QCI23192.1 NADH-quinone oxidoreductase subunit M [Buchnera aphidicola (Melaphis rhois)]